MAATDLRDAIQAKAAAIKQRSTSSTIDGWAEDIRVLAEQILTVYPSIIERRTPHAERRLADRPVSTFRRRNQRRHVAAAAIDTVVETVAITSAVPAAFVVGQTYQVTYEAKNRLGHIITPTTVSFSSSAPSIVSINSTTGLATALAAGTAVLTVMADTVSATVTLTVTAVVSPPTVATVTVTGPTTVQVGQTITLTATAKDSSNNVLLNKVVTWSELSGSGDVTLSADSGVDPHTTTVTGVTAGDRVVRATCETVPGNYTVTVTGVPVPPPPPPPPPTPGAYTALAAEYWYTLTSKAQAAGKVGTEANLGQLFQPVLPATDFYDVVTGQMVPKIDNTVGTGAVMRYLGKVSLNSYPVILEALVVGTAGNNIALLTSPASSGNSNHRKWTIQNHPTSPTITEVYDNLTRQTILAAINGISALVRVNTNMNTGITLLPGGPNPPATQTNTFPFGGGTATVKAFKQMGDNAPGRTAVHTVGFGAGNAKRDLWIHTAIRFSTNWTTASTIGGQGAPSHKMIFIRHLPASRTEWTIESVRGWFAASGGVASGGTLQSNVALPHHNVISMDQQYNTSGWPHVDLYNDQNNPGTFKMFKTPGPFPASPGNAPFGDGSGEWFEIYWHVQSGVPSAPTQLKMTQAMRQLTQGGVRNPLPWRYFTNLKTLTGGTWSDMIRYEQGVNRNRQWDEDMYMDWAFYEVVDGALYPDPWGLGF